MSAKYYYIGIFLLLFSFQMVMAGPTKKWSHIEYGAANDGGDLTLLFRTLDQLIAEHLGSEITFFVNDLTPKNSEYAAGKLRNYAATKGYAKAIIRALPGDYTRIEIPETDSAHLRNPEGGAFPNDGYRSRLMQNPNLTSEQAPKSAEILQRLADKSATGLKIITWRIDDIKTIEGNSNLNFQRLGRDKNYIFRDGKKGERTYGYRLPPTVNCNSLMRRIGVKP